MAETFPYCLPIQLPVEDMEDAIARAYSFNPANAIPVNVAKPEHLAVLKTSYWGPKGVKLGVSFLEQVTTGFKNKFLEHANAWGKKANVEFKLSSNGEVRLSLQKGGGYWSYLGTDILGIKAGQPTMNLDSFTESTPEREWKRVVRHEVGHTLGFPHEHMRKEIVDKIDPAKAYSYFKQRVGWNKQMVDSQVLTAIEETKLISTHARANSIMCYQLPGSIMKDGVDVPGGNDIDIVDVDLCRKLYPRL